MLRRNYVIDVVERVYQSYGFEPLETPTMERLSTLLGKYGEDEKLIFRVMKRGDKLEAALGDQPTEDSVGDAGMRYDLTVPLARVVAQYRNDLPSVFKRYQIQPVYRADRPAKGRYPRVLPVRRGRGRLHQRDGGGGGAQRRRAGDAGARLRRRASLCHPSQPSRHSARADGDGGRSARHWRTRRWSPSTSWTRSGMDGVRAELDGRGMDARSGRTAAADHGGRAAG